jgi:chromosome segregation ATPase
MGALAEQLKARQEELALANADLDTARARVTELETSITAGQEQIAAVTAENEQLKAEIEAARAAQATAEAEMNEAKALLAVSPAHKAVTGGVDSATADKLGSGSGTGGEPVTAAELWKTYSALPRGERMSWLAAHQDEWDTAMKAEIASRKQR